MSWWHEPGWWALGVSVVGTVGNTLWNWLNWRNDRAPKIAFDAVYEPAALSKGMFSLRNVGRKTVTIERIYSDMDTAHHKVMVEVARGARTTLAPGESLLFRAVVMTPHRKIAALRDVLVSVQGQKQPVRVETRMK